LVDPAAAAELHQVLADGPDVFAIAPRIATSVPATFIWQPGQQGPVAIAQDGHGERMGTYGTGSFGLNFLVVTYGDHEPQARGIEDGLVLMMPGRVWRELLDCLGEARPFNWRAAGTRVVLRPRGEDAGAASRSDTR